MSSKTRAADDFAAIRARMEALNQERTAKFKGGLQVGMAVKVLRVSDGGVVNSDHIIDATTLITIQNAINEGRWKVEILS